ncbi:MAG: hypothetical protein ACJ8DI_28830, partial [Ktedonobacteraceae bacterium]
ECMHGVKQCLSLFSGRREFQEHGLFHRTSVDPLIEIVNGSATAVARPFLPIAEASGLLDA